jgi:putative transposase
VGHTYSNLLLHVVFATKERRPIIHDSLRLRLYEYLSGIARNEFGKAIAIGGTGNHVHGLLVVGTNWSTAKAMQKWKGLSSKWVHETFPGEHDFAWQDGYGAFSISQSNVKQVATYIEEQAEHHKRITFEEEYVALLKRHGIAYDPRYVFT